MGDGPAGEAEWAGRFRQQAAACDSLGSELWGRVLRIVAADVLAGGRSWGVVRERADLRFGQAGPLRLLGTAHRLALAGDDPAWAGLLPSCGGTAPAGDADGDAVLRDAWDALLEAHRDELVAGMDREVQTNEVARAAALGLAHAVAWSGAGSGHRPGAARLVELGCSGGLNLRLDRFRLDLTSGADGGSVAGGVVLGDPEGRVRIAPEVRAPLTPGLSGVRIAERIGIDPHPIDPTSDDGRLTLLSFVWPDQTGRFERLAAAIDLAAEVPATLIPTGDRTTAEVLDDVLGAVIGGPTVPGVATIVQHSVVWQYIPTAQRPAITAVLERVGRAATPEAPLVWVRFEPDEWDRTRAAVWVRSWPGGGDRLVAHADYHGRWLAPVPPHSHSS